MRLGGGGAGVGVGLEGVGGRVGVGAGLEGVGGRVGVGAVGSGHVCGPHPGAGGCPVQWPTRPLGRPGHTKVIDMGARQIKHLRIFCIIYIICRFLM